MLGGPAGRNLASLATGEGASLKAGPPFLPIPRVYDVADPNNFQFLRDPLKMCRVLWPHFPLWSREKELFYSVWHNKETVCVAGNMLGKDFTAGMIALTYFLTRTPCRILTTSVDGTQLEGVLWGEIRRLIQESKVPLDSRRGGPLLINHLHIRKVFTSGPMKSEVCGLSYLLGRVAAKGEGMLGHHIAEIGDGIPRTMFIGDEASGLDDLSIDRGETWADRILLIGNPYPCTNRFYRDSEAGDLLSKRRVKYWEGVTLEGGHTDQNKTVEHYTRKVIRIPCAESPNVRLGEIEVAKGLEPSGEMLVPGVMSYWKYRERREKWDEVKQCIQLDAQFYKGSELLLFPPTWLIKSGQLVSRLKCLPRRARAIGCDPGEGSAETAWAVVDDYGLLEMRALQTPDTSIICGETAALMRKWNVPGDMMMFDKGGGGTQIAHEMRRLGHAVRTVGFGEPVTPEPKRGMTSVQHQIENREDRYSYVSRRAQIYHNLSMLLDPQLGDEIELFTQPSVGDEVLVAIAGLAGNPLPQRVTDRIPRFCIPESETELLRQLGPIPKLYDKEGRMRLPAKNKNTENSKEKTLVEIIGCSPDRADALVIALYCRDYAPKAVRAGAA